MLFEIFREQENVIESCVRQPVMTVAINAGRRGMEPRHDRGAGGVTHRGIAVGVSKQYPFSRQRVEVGRIHIERLTVQLSGSPVIEVINRHKQDIGSTGTEAKEQGLKENE